MRFRNNFVVIGVVSGEKIRSATEIQTVYKQMRGEREHGDWYSKRSGCEIRSTGNEKHREIGVA